MPNNAEALLKRLQRKGSSAQELLPLYQDPEHEALWRQNPDLYRVFTRRLISEGNPTRAFDIAREGLAAHADDHELKYLLALALARGGNLRGAEKYLADLLQQSELEAKLRVEALSLEGRLFKDRYERTREAGRKAELAARSAASYRAAAEVPGADSFPRINAATMTFLSGDNPPARELAKSVLDQIQQELQKTDGPEDYWKLASLGEACLILERFDDAAAWYGKAVATAGERRDIGSIAAMARTRRPPRRRKARLPQPGSGGNGTSSPCCCRRQGAPDQAMVERVAKRDQSRPASRIAMAVLENLFKFFRKPAKWS